MPDKAAVTMADVLDKRGPALSATSDVPEAVAAPPVSVEVNKAGEGKPGDILETGGEGGEDEAADKGGEGEAADKGEGGEGEAADKGGEGEGGEAKPEIKVDADGKPIEPPKGVKKRLDELTAQRGAAERRAEQLAADLGRALTTIQTLTGKDAKKTEEKVETDDPRPKREAFDNPDAYDTALIGWSARAATRVAQAEAETQRTTETQTKALETLQQNWKTRRDAAIEKNPDYAEVAEADDVTITVPMAHSILQLDNGPDVAYYLGKNKAEATRIAALPQAMQVLEIGKLSNKVAAPPAPKVSVAPKPIKPIGNKNSAGAKAAEEMTMEEYAAHRGAQIAAERRGFNGQKAKPH